MTYWRLQSKTDLLGHLNFVGGPIPEDMEKALSNWKPASAGRPPHYLAWACSNRIDGAESFCGRSLHYAVQKIVEHLPDRKIRRVPICFSIRF
ncbi:hypothetical protein GOP47_0009557 [Adiantum capillus-veneris]|uniref:Uncharacterized protein n=1 Tax=Adiantum capillus-veneris TaxID=13818 RepID=A0A9D4UWV8_ADICA|nr:hypothetical protein GOP47_0009557 [Adiantum capillus-veneris]